MGSSKRSHKDRTRGKRSRSRSGSRERSGHDRKGRKETRNTEAERREADDEPEEGEITPEHDVRGEEVSLSIAETNKLRAKLGLKPLEDDSAKAADGDDSYDKRPEVFVKTDNISDKIEAEKVKERVSVVREKRKYAEKLRATKALADSDSDEDVVSWVDRQRELEKRKAEQKAKELEELDQEMERQQEQEDRKQRAYRQEHLKGLTVAHAVDAVKEGSQVVLTLRDRDILEEDADVLENVNLVDDEKAAENVINRKKGLNDYNPYDLGEDGLGKGMLSKYDETIAGKAQQKFTIGSNAMDDVQQKIKAMREAATSGKVLFSLEDGGVRAFASEFYTEEEMLKFKKPKNVRRKQTLRKRNTADDIVPSAVLSSGDSGSRTKAQPPNPDEDPIPKIKENENSAKKKVDTNLILREVEKMDTDETEEDLSGVTIDDEAENELQEALERARKLKEKTKSAEAKLEEFARKIIVKTEDEDMETSGPSAVVFNATSEFCRNLGDVSSYTAGPPSARDSDDEEEEVVVRKREEKRDIRDVSTKKAKEDEQRKGDWRQVDLDAEEDDAYQSKSSSSGSSQKSRRKVVKSVPILEEEPDASQGVAAALRLAMNKGYLDKEVTKSAPQKKAIEAVSYTIEEKFHDEEKGRGRDRYAGPLSEFKDKSGYKPDVKLEYVDDHGRVMSQKEAFRVLSHKFHGKGPGKNKIDKRQQKLLQESKLRQMSSIDTPLNTVQKLQEKQKELSLPYVVLSGAG